MGYPSTMQPVQRKQSHWGLIIIVGILAVLLLILLTIVGFWFVANRNSRTSLTNSLLGTNPINQLDVDNIDPALALASLGGVPEIEVVTQAIDKDRAETALSGLLFEPALTNKESVGSFVELAKAYATRGDRDRSVFSYELAGTVATLAPDLSDTARADYFLQVGEGLIKLNEPDLAKFYLNQAFTVAEASPYLQAAHRRGIFERLHKDYQDINERALARASLSLSANPPNLELITEERVILPDGAPAPLPTAAQDAEANRWLAAQELAANLVQLGGNAPQTKVEILAEALRVEDQAKVSYFETELANTTQLSKRLDIILAKIDWLSTKYRVARRGYGLSIVPEWEDQAEQIRADLTKTYEALYALYADFIIALPQLSQIDKATEERLRREILAGELGRYPNYPEQQRQAQLLDATEQLINTQPELKVFIGVGAVNDKEMFTLISLEE